MDQQDKQRAENLCKIIKLLPDAKQEYLLGVADGMAAMAAGRRFYGQSSENSRNRQSRP